MTVIGNHCQRATPTFGLGALILILLYLNPADATITISVNNTFFYQRYPGESVTFYCNVTSDSTVTAITWYKNNVLYSNTGRASGGFPSQPSLTIQNLVEADRGSYICSATNAASEMKNSSHITLGISPTNSPANVQIRFGTASVSVNSGNSLELNCSAKTGTPTPTYTWTKGSSTTTIWTGSPYTITSASTSSAGQYTCTATNVVGSATATVNVVVYTAPTTVSVSAPSQNVNAGSTVQFTCNANGSPSQSYQWYKSLSAITNAVSQTYVIASATGSDAGDYKCQAYNNAGSLTSAVVTLTVNTAVRPTNATVAVVPSSGQVNEGGSFTLTCSSDGTTPTFSWSRNTDSSTWSGASVTITNAGELDNAVYVCQASNDAGSIWTSYGVTVIFSPKNVTISPTALTVSIGDPITLTCNSDGTSSTFTWTHNARTFTGATVTISSAAVTDSGTYTCQASNSAGSLTSSVSVIVQFAPQTVTISPTSLSVTSGDSIQLTCNADGLPIPTYKWIKDSNTWDGQTLTIATSSGSDAGDYTCQASNSEGNKTATVTVNVLVSAPNNIGISPSSLSIYSGQAIQINCTSDGSEPLTYTWFKESDNSTWNNKTLIISPASVNDAGVYICEASNYAGSLNKSATVEVILPGAVENLRLVTSLPVVNEGDFVQLICNASSSTPVTYSLSKGDNSWTGQVLNITSASAADVGFYICQATNLAGSSFTSYYLNVVLPPQNVTISPISQTVRLGDPVILTCNSDGTEPKNYTWTQADRKWNGQLLNITSATVTDTGVYICQASNTAGMTTSSVNVIVKYVPRTIIITPSSSSPAVEKNASISLSCQADASPPPTYQWIKDGTVVVEGSVLNISSASASDAGAYICRASNDLGSVNETVTLDVIIYNAPQNITITAPSLSVNSGETIQLTCNADGSPSQNYSWFKGDNSWTGPTLEITSASSSDTGNYTCRASNPAGSLNTTVNVAVFVAPNSVSINPPSITVNSGDAILLACNASGAPSQTYTWIRGGNSREGSLLNITSASPSDSGVYTCRASNSAGSLNGTAEVIVYSAPNNVTISPSKLSINEGDTINLSCDADGTPTQTFTWYHGAAAWEGPTLTVSRVRKSEAGTYTCQSANQAGSLNASVEVTVYSAPQNVRISPSSITVNTSDSIHLTCTADGLPTQSFKWMKGDKSWDGPALNITSVSASDAGLYTCEASNPAGSSNATVNVIVTVQGFLSPSSVTITTNSSYTGQVIEGGSVQLICTADGSPSQTYSWSNTNNVWNGQSLTITSATISDAGFYICQATNPAGSVFRSFSLTVVVAPKNVTVSPFSKIVTSGQSFQLTCDGDGIPSYSQNYTWTMGGRIWYGQILTIQSASTLDNGVFTCRVSNIAGELTSIANVYINFAPSNFQFSKTSPLVVVLGQPIAVTCSSAGSPTPSYTWNKGGTTYSGATLSISSAAVSDDGVYTCTGTNSVNSASASFEVDVQYAPQITVSTAQSSVSATDGQTVTLTCSNNANPTVSVYEWTCEGTTINRTQDIYTLVISGTNDFQCSCKAFNTIGASASQNFSVTVSASTGGDTGNTGAATGSTGLTTGEIAAIAVAVLFILLIIIVIIVCCCLYGVCAGFCGKKEKAKVEPTEKEKEVIHRVEIPRFEEVPRFKPRVPSAVTRNDVTLTVNQDNVFDEEADFEIKTKYELVPPGSHRSVNGTIISLQDQRSPRAHHLPALDLTYDEEERRRKRRRRKKKHHRHREPAEGMESPHRPRESSRSRREHRRNQESREIVMDDEMYHSRYDEGDLVVIPGPE